MVNIDKASKVNIGEFYFAFLHLNIFVDQKHCKHFRNYHN